MRIDVVDNGGQWTHREWRVLKYCDVDSEIIPNTTPFENLKCDGLLLSGGALRIGWEAPKLGNCSVYLDRARFPILGMCAAHQLMAIHFGGEAGPAEVPEYGQAELTIDSEDEIFEGVPKESQVWESHNDEVKVLPPVFVSLAHSKDCRFQAIKHKERPIYGFQFHPEVEQTEFGTKMIENFVRICRRLKEYDKSRK